MSELGITGEEIDNLRSYVIPALDWAVVGGKDNTKHPHYLAVTEGHPGSSCGFLPSWLYFRAGVRLPWINRTENGGYKVGKNISELSWEKTASVRKDPGAGSLFETGDALIVWALADTSDAHAMVVRSHDPQMGLLEVSEAGQPGAHTSTKHIYEKNGKLWLKGSRGDKQVQRWLSFARVIQVAAEAGKLVEPTFPPGF